MALSPERQSLREFLGVGSPNENTSPNRVSTSQNQSQLGSLPFAKRADIASKSAASDPIAAVLSVSLPSL